MIHLFGFKRLIEWEIFISYEISCRCTIMRDKGQQNTQKCMYDATWCLLCVYLTDCHVATHQW